jgi:hypothetical protein
MTRETEAQIRTVLAASRVTQSTVCEIAITETANDQVIKTDRFFKKSLKTDGIPV